MAADHRVVLADDETVRIVSPALPGHVRVASPSGRPQLDDGAKCAVTHAFCNNLIMKIIPDSRIGEFEPILDQVRRGGRTAVYETKRMRKDGTIIDVLISISPILDDSGAVTGIAAVVRNVTERNWIEAERQEAEARHREAELTRSRYRQSRGVPWGSPGNCSCSAVAGPPRPDRPT